MGDGKTVETPDVYGLIMEQMNDDVRLHSWRCHYCKSLSPLAELAASETSHVLREMKASETLANLLEYSEGLAGDACMKSVRIIRRAVGSIRSSMLDDGLFPGKLSFGRLWT